MGHERRLRVMHFVSGGFSGATGVAVALARAAQRSPHQQALLVLRAKRQTDPARVEALREAGLAVEVVPGWSNIVTILALIAVCRRWQPDILVAHGFSEHLWGRWAGWLAKVPALVHVEHNTRERYGFLRLAQARWLARRTARIIGCSEGVRQELLGRGFPNDRILAIPNGIPLQPFTALEPPPLEERVAGLVMVARFSGQKDHLTLIDALALLRERGFTPPLQLVGLGSERHRTRVVQRVQARGLAAQVTFVGHSTEVPALLMRHALCVLSTHHEGMPLALVEGMAAGCAVVGSDVPGVRELIEDGHTGRLVRAADPVALADVLEDLLRRPHEAARLARAARQQALARFGLERMSADYERVFEMAFQEATP